MQNTEGDTKPNIPRRPSSKGFGNKVFSDVPVHSVWRLLSLLLLILCLIQLIGLVGFGIRYHPCKPCPEHWYWHGNNCYKIMMENLTWSESREACAFQNSSLVKIDNKEEWYFVTAKIERYHWVGLSRNARDLPLKWEDGSEVNSEVLLLLSDGKTEGKLCAVVYRNDLNLDICKKMYPFICERAADPVKKELLT
ncbi:C-type lectin domain family 1 member B-like isoform X2 [Ornithorhynchus anatinus]|uniref:C-type lectin domain-containing protein n=1 Tax=Ornithorhynchus anatinus TaxID=9258 RepID=A0A6I8NDA6_ORNAN|nr:C-type lectin domain family 1 member B-like isoform X2 [Ornithorhynchus anatinus]